MRISILIIIIGISLFSCKTIILNDDIIINNIPESIELIKIPAGAYSSGELADIKYLEYDYSMMKYPVTNSQYVEFLKTAHENGDVNITNESIAGYYGGDKNWSAGIYEFIDIDDPDCRIVFNQPHEFDFIWHWFGSFDEHTTG